MLVFYCMECWTNDAGSVVERNGSVESVGIQGACMLLEECPPSQVEGCAARIGANWACCTGPIAQLLTAAQQRLETFVITH